MSLAPSLMPLVRSLLPLAPSLMSLVPTRGRCYNRIGRAVGQRSA
jgi:hypothetical protein